MGGLYVVLGAAGAIGGAVVRELAGRGAPVRAVTRNAGVRWPDGIEACAADLSSLRDALRACEGAEVVYHCAQPAYDRWREAFPPLNAAIAEAASRCGTKLVLADNLYMYGPIAGPIREQTPQLPASRKGRLRKRLADELLGRHGDGGLRVAIGRASDYYGPGGRASVAGDVLFEAAVAGRSVRWPASADQPRTFSYLPDVARALVTLGERDEADGRAWILPAAPPVTARELVGLLERALGRSVSLAVTSRLSMRLAGIVIREARELPDIWYQFAAPFVVDASRFEATFGPLPATAHEVGVAETVDWFQSLRVGKPG